MTLTYQFEPLSVLLDEGLAALAEEHWRAIALDHDAVPLDVDWDGYQKREDGGSWRAFTARRDDRLVGYVGFFLFHPERYSSTLFVSDDTIWVLPSEPARGLIWRGLVRAAMEQVPRPCKFQMRTRPRFGGVVTAKILESLGFSLDGMIFSTYLK